MFPNDARPIAESLHETGRCPVETVTDTTGRPVVVSGKTVKAYKGVEGRVANEGNYDVGASTGIDHGGHVARFDIVERDGLMDVNGDNLGEGSPSRRVNEAEYLYCSKSVIAAP